MALASLRPNQLKPYSRISDVLATEWLTPSPEVGASQLRRQDLLLILLSQRALRLMCQSCFLIVLSSKELL